MMSQRKMDQFINPEYVSLDPKFLGELETEDGRRFKVATFDEYENFLEQTKAIDSLPLLLNCAVSIRLAALFIRDGTIAQNHCKLPDHGRNELRSLLDALPNAVVEDFYQREALAHMLDWTAAVLIKRHLLAHGQAEE